MLKDCRGHRLTGATEKSLPHYETAVRELNLFINDPVASVDKAIAESPDFVMAHALRAWLHLLGTEPAGIPVARAALRCRLEASRHRAGAGPPHRHRSSDRRPLACGRAGDGGRRDRIPARPARAAGRPPARLLPRRSAHAARPHRARAAGVVEQRAGLSRDARHARLRPRGDRRLRRRRGRRPHRGRARTRAMPGRSMPSRM